MARSTTTSKAGSKTKTVAKQDELPTSVANSDGGLMELFVDGIRDMYWAENQLVKCLPKMQQSAADDALADAIATHLEETRTHVERLEQVFDLLGEPARAQKCDAMEGLTKEGEAIIEKTEAGTLARDTGVIMASRKVEHYEMAAYDGLIQLATRLGLTDIASILQDTLSEEQNSDAILSQISLDATD